MNKTLINVLIGAVVGALILWAGILIAPKASEITNNLGAVASPWFVGPEMGINGLNTYVASGDFKNGTTTIVSILNPTPATATVDFVALKNTGVATSSYTLFCGSYARPSAIRVGGTPSLVLLQTEMVATSTNFGTITNNATSTNSVLAFTENWGTQDRITINPGQYFVCIARGANQEDSLKIDGGWDSAFTNALNTFDGKFKVRFLWNSW